MKKQGQRPLEELIHAGLGGWGVFKFRKRKISMAPEHVAKETPKIMTPKVATKVGHSEARTKYHGLGQDGNTS